MKTTSFSGPVTPLQDRALQRCSRRLHGGFKALHGSFRTFLRDCRSLQGGCRGLALFRVISILAIGISASSCIYERPRGDEFYRTLWTSDEQAFEGITVEFLCDGGVSVMADTAAGSIGTYTFDGPTAIFHDLILRYGSVSVILEEGYRDGDLMTVTWHHADSQEARTVLMYRLSAYR